jgi:hypothetical protein
MRSTAIVRRVLLTGMKSLIGLLLMMVCLAAPAAAGDYSYANRPHVVFHGPRGGSVHVSPFPMSKRSAAIWTSDACWRACTSAAAWRFARCTGIHGAEACRAVMDSDDRACLRSCRTRGGPYVNVTEY